MHHKCIAISALYTACSRWVLLVNNCAEFTSVKKEWAGRVAQRSEVVMLFVDQHIAGVSS